LLFVIPEGLIGDPLLLDSCLRRNDSYNVFLRKSIPANTGTVMTQKIKTALIPTLTGREFSLN